MEFAYLDESGDLGSDSGHLILVLMCTRKVKRITKLVRNVKQTILKKNKHAKWLNQHGGEIKFYGFPDKKLLERFLKELSNIDMHIYYLCFVKEGAIKEDVKPTILGYLFTHIFNNSNSIPPKKVVADLNFFSNRNKVNYFSLEKYETSKVIEDNGDGSKKEHSNVPVSFRVIDEKEYSKMKDCDETRFPLIIEHKNSRQSELLQATDIISGALFRKFENKDSYYINFVSGGKAKLSGQVLRKK